MKIAIDRDDDTSMGLSVSEDQFVLSAGHAQLPNMLGLNTRMREQSNRRTSKALVEQQLHDARLSSMSASSRFAAANAKA